MLGNRKIILHVVGAMNVGGTETMLMNLYRNIDSNKYQFHFVVYTKDKCVYDDEILSLGGMIHRINSPFDFLGLRKIIKKVPNITAFHIHTYFSCGISALYAKLLGVKNIISHSHTSFEIGGSIVNVYYQKLSRILINNCSDRLAACSNKSALSLFGHNNYYYTPNFVDPDKFLNINSINNFNFPNDKILVGHIGRFSLEKNHDFILKCAEYAKQNKLPLFFILIGDGEEKNTVDRYVKDKLLSDFVTILGQRSDIPSLIHSFDKFILPSTVEGFGLVLVEAQVCGKQCVVSQAIQPEAILDLNLVTQLDFDVELWCKELLKPTKNITNKSCILQSLQNAKMDLNSTIKLFEDLYEKKHINH